jgi:hypothetical protein
VFDQILRIRVRQPQPEVSVVVIDDLAESRESAVVIHTIRVTRRRYRT